MTTQKTRHTAGDCWRNILSSSRRVRKVPSTRWIVAYLFLFLPLWDYHCSIKGCHFWNFIAVESDWNKWNSEGSSLRVRFHFERDPKFYVTIYLWEILNCVAISLSSSKPRNSGYPIDYQARKECFSQEKLSSFASVQLSLKLSLVRLWAWNLVSANLGLSSPGV